LKLSNCFWQTYKEIPADAQIPSHILMSRAGLILKEAAGLYNYLPMGLRVIKKIENIVREEMDKVSCQELSMSVVTPGELWKETGRWDKMEGLMLKFKDQGDRDLCISPTNEEAITDIFRKTIKSYKLLPVKLYQINTKFRDEIRPRFGLMRGREFTMKDAYTFHLNKESLDETYDEMFHAYEKILGRMNLKFFPVEADAGAIGSTDSKTHEFHILAEAGEDELIYCDKTGYAANIEKAQTKRQNLEFNNNSDKLEEVETPDTSTIESVCSFLEIPQHHSLKSLVYTGVKEGKEKHVLILILGDDELNEIKLKNYLNVDNVMPSSEEVISDTGMVSGFIGALNLKKDKDIEILIDNQVDINCSYVTGANKKDYHFKNFIPSRELKGNKNHNQIDVRLSKKGDRTLDDKGTVDTKRGIEAGHIFQLGNQYTKAMGATILDQNGKAVAPLMGCYGMGITRIAAAAIEQNYDDKGIVWPKEIAPYQVHFVLIGKSEEIKAKGNEVYNMLNGNFETLYDDRKEGPGFKFKDADLLGCPMIVALGEKGYKLDGMLEVTNRQSGEKTKSSFEDLVLTLNNLWETLK